MKNIKESGRTEANVNNPTVQDNRGQELTLNEKLEMRHRINQLILQKAVKTTLKKVEKLLVKGEYEAAANELKMAVDATGDVRVRLPFALMSFWEMGGEGIDIDMDMLLYHLRLAADDGHIPSMHLLGMLYNNGHVTDVYHEGQIMSNRANILDPTGKLWNYLNVVLSARVKSRSDQVTEIIKAIHEPASHFYNHEEAGKAASLLDISTVPNRRFTEVIGDHNCEELLKRCVSLLHAGYYTEVECFLKLAAHYDVVAANHHLTMLYKCMDLRKEAFESTNSAVAFGSVPLMYTLSAMYRCGYGLKKSNLMADAWYWKAVESDINNRGLMTTITL